MIEPEAAGPTIGAILAGGRARRLGGGDKPLRLVGGRTILARQIDCLTPQVARIIISANDDPARFAHHGLPVVPDTVADRAGPLAGILAVLDWVFVHAPGVDRAVTIPGDAPFIPPDLVARLHAARCGATVVCAASNGRTHPVVALWPVSLRDTLRHALLAQGMRRVGTFAETQHCAIANFPATPVDPFFNVNTPGDVAEADRLARSCPSSRGL